MTATTTKGYDERGLQISKQEPLGNSCTYQYNQRGQLSQANDPKGKTVANQYYDDGVISGIIDIKNKNSPEKVGPKIIPTKKQTDGKMIVILGLSKIIIGILFILYAVS
jgi:YD repeat-containing protein